MNEPARLLQEALDVLDHGSKWIKGEFQGWVRDEEGDHVREGYCSIGALRVAAQREGCSLDSAYYNMAMGALWGALSEEDLWAIVPPRMSGDRIARFNDAGSTTWEDVALMFKKAINHLDP